MRVDFTKMEGAGNDFVVIDATVSPFALTAAQLRRLADRHFGVGCDQILVVGQSTRADADFRYRIFNADGGEVAACGNATRCIALLLAREGEVRGLRRQSARKAWALDLRVSLVALFALCALAQWVGTSIMIAGFAAGHRLATTVGTRTAGNVLGAANFKVGGGYTLRLPIFGWYTPRGDCLEGQGVSPDITVDVDPYRLNAGFDEQMGKALEILRGAEGVGAPQ